MTKVTIRNGPKKHRLALRFLDDEMADGNLQNTVTFDLEDRLLTPPMVKPMDFFMMTIYMMYCMDHAGRSDWMMIGYIPQLNNRPVFVRYSCETGRGYANIADPGVEFDSREFARVIKEMVV